MKAKIWRNEIRDDFTCFNVTVCRVYRGKDEWKTSESFGRDDLLVLGKVADQAHSWIVQQQQESKKAANAEAAHAQATA